MSCWPAGRPWACGQPDAALRLRDGAARCPCSCRAARAAVPRLLPFVTIPFEVICCDPAVLFVVEWSTAGASFFGEAMKRVGGARFPLDELADAGHCSVSQAFNVLADLEAVVRVGAPAADPGVVERLVLDGDGRRRADREADGPAEEEAETDWIAVRHGPAQYLLEMPIREATNEVWPALIPNSAASVACTKTAAVFASGCDLKFARRSETGSATAAAATPRRSPCPLPLIKYSPPPRTTYG